MGDRDSDCPTQTIRLPFYFFHPPFFYHLFFYSFLFLDSIHDFLLLPLLYVISISTQSKLNPPIADGKKQKGVDDSILLPIFYRRVPLSLSLRWGSNDTLFQHTHTRSCILYSLFYFLFLLFPSILFFGFPYIFREEIERRRTVENKSNTFQRRRTSNSIRPIQSISNLEIF